MEALLIREWLGADAENALRTIDDASVSAARELVRDFASASKLAQTTTDRGVNVVSELARNQLRHARGGRILVRTVTRGDVQGLEIVAADSANGIADPATALDGRPRVTGSLGVGLAAVRELAFEVDFDVRILEGTCVRARIFDAEVPRRAQIGIFGRPFPGEPESGDHAAFRRDDGLLLLAVCDGLGHGVLARNASDAACMAFLESPSSAPASILEACGSILGPTRGAVMAVLAVDEEGRRAKSACAGNIGVQIYAGRAAHRFGGVSVVLGSPQRRPIPTEEAPMPEGATLVLFTDGITSRLALENELELLRQHPIVIAQRIVERFARPDDDALVLVAR